MSSLALLMQNYSDSEDENKSNDEEKNKKKIKLMNDEIKQEEINENDSRYSSSSSLNSSKSIDLSLNFNFKKDIQESIEQIEVTNQTKFQEINNIKVNDTDDKIEIIDEVKNEITNNNNELITIQNSDDDESNEIEGGQYSPKSFNRLLLGLDPDKIKLPKMPKNKKCSDNLIEKINHLHNLMKQGKNMNEIIQEKKSFRNPSIYEKLISYCEIDEFGTNLPIEVYNPPSFEEKDNFPES